MNEIFFIIFFIIGSLFTPLIILIVKYFVGKNYKDFLIEKLQSDIDFLNQQINSEKEKNLLQQAQLEKIQNKLIELIRDN